MITVFVNLLDGRMDQIDFRIFLGQPNYFLAKLWLVLVVIGSKYDIVSRSERNAVVPLAYEIFASDVFFVPEVTNPRIRSSVYDEEMKNYKTNLQMNFCHSSISNEEPDFNVLLKINKNNSCCKDKNKNIFEISDKDLDSLINKLKDIYGQIKS